MYDDSFHERFVKRLTSKRLKQEAGARGFTRGKRMFAAGKVVHLEEISAEIDAEVEGEVDGANERFFVRIWLQEGGLMSSCVADCNDFEPVFCPHAVAVGLAWLERGPAGMPERRVSWLADMAVVLRPVVRRMDRAEVERQRQQDPEELWHRLQIERARDRKGQFRPAVFRRQIDIAIRTPDRMGALVALHSEERILWLAPTLVLMHSHIDG